MSAARLIVTVRQALQEFRILLDPYYLKTALLIAHNAIARQYRNSFMGILWMLIMPLTQVLIFSIVMPRIMRFPVEDYVLFLVSVYPLWSFISSCLVGATASLTSQAETIKRCVISKTVFPIADVLRQFYTYLVSFGVMYLFCMLFAWKWSPLILLVPLYLLPVLVIVTALAVAISFVAPYIRDIMEALMVVMNVGFWLTPVIYPISVVPEHLQRWFYLNPFHIMLRPMYLLGYEQRIPGFLDTFLLLALTAAAVAGSYAVYRVCRRNFVYYL